MSQEKKGAPSAGLYVTVALKDFREKLQAIRQIIMVVNRSAYERNMHAFEISGESGADDKSALDFVQLVQEGGFVALVAGAASFAATLEADGVILDDMTDIEPARKILGEEGIVGLRCGKDIKLAEAALAQGIDFVSFSSDISEADITVWSSKTSKPCLVDGDLSCETAARFVKAGATFIQGHSYIFDHPKGALQGAVNMVDALERSSEMSKSIN